MDDKLVPRKADQNLPNRIDIQSSGRTVPLSNSDLTSILFILLLPLEPANTSAMLPNVICYIGHRHRQFMELFRKFGLVTRSPEAQC